MKAIEKLPQSSAMKRIRDSLPDRQALRLTQVGAEHIAILHQPCREEGFLCKFYLPNTKGDEHAEANDRRCDTVSRGVFVYSPMLERYREEEQGTSGSQQNAADQILFNDLAPQVESSLAPALSTLGQQPGLSGFSSVHEQNDVERD
jgi:hypothetical protein